VNPANEAYSFVAEVLFGEYGEMEIKLHMTAAEVEASEAIQDAIASAEGKYPEEWVSVSFVVS
jgi:hypothetical protein